MRLIGTTSAEKVTRRGGGTNDLGHNELLIGQVLNARNSWKGDRWQEEMEEEVKLTVM